MTKTGINMFRAREGVDSLDDLIPRRTETGFLRHEDFRLADGSVALVYYHSTPSHPPKWASFFAGIIDRNHLRNAASSAVVVFQREGIWYLVTFGYARYLLNLDLVEREFGLRVTLNGVDPSKIRAIDRQRVDAVTRLTREQLSRDSRMGVFALDVRQDLLSSLTGVPTDEALGTRLFGKDSVGLRVDTRPEALGQIADQLETLFRAEDYREAFAWVDNIAEVRGEEDRALLDERLVAMLRDGEGEFDLAPPDIIDWETAEEFIYADAAESPKVELRLEDYFRLVIPHDEITLDQLRHDMIRLFDADGNRLQSWSTYRCLHGELGIGEEFFVLVGGSWFRVDQDFAREIDAYVDRVSGEAVALPPYMPGDGDEAAYLARAADSSDGDLKLMDQVFVYPRSWQDRIEFCDLYRGDLTMVHVKRYVDGSAPLSHLFKQGSVSFRCLLGDRAFRRDVAGLLQPDFHIDEDAPDPGDCIVIYAIVGPRGRAFRLPFFSRVALRNEGDVIEQLGGTVILQTIENRQPVA